MLNRLERYATLLISYSRPRMEFLEYMFNNDSGTIVVKSAQLHRPQRYHLRYQIWGFIVVISGPKMALSFEGEVS